MGGGQLSFISAWTADRHIQNIYTKVSAANRTTASRWAMDQGIVSVDTDARADPS
jgi:DNA-binding NarL/FixJ family response regulator